jgi:hypothetical protein
LESEAAASRSRIHMAIDAMWSGEPK